MRRTQVTDCRVFSFDAACVYAALIDFGSYPKWWPSELRLKVLRETADLVGSRFEVRPRGGSFVCEVVALDDQRELQIRYVDGLHRGTGLWTLRQHENGTQVCYQIDLEPQGFVPRLLSHVINFASIHSNGMEKVFDGLQQWLSTDGSSIAS
jgi:ribosome-associated toxin RatA of RatAB toxin-antitoxin module